MKTTSEIIILTNSPVSKNIIENIMVKQKEKIVAAKNIKAI